MLKPLLYKTALLIAMIITVIPVSHAQERDGIDGKFSDSIPFVKVEPFFVTDLDSLRAYTLDTIHKPFGYVILTYPFRGTAEISIAIKKKTGYQVFQVHGYETYHTGDDSIRVTRLDFNGKGSKEVVIHYARIYGRDIGTDGGDEWQEGFYIWDPDNTTCLAAFENYRSYAGWWKEFDPKESDSLDFESRTVINAGGDTTCTSYAYELKKGEIIFEKNIICNKYNEELPQQATSHKGSGIDWGKMH